VGSLIIKSQGWVLFFELKGIMSFLIIIKSHCSRLLSPVFLLNVFKGIQNIVEVNFKFFLFICIILIGKNPINSRFLRYLNKKTTTTTTTSESESVREKIN